MAARCTHYLKPLLEAGTQGTRGSASVFIPHVTEEYKAPASTPSEDAPYPVCTVRYFPSTVEHTLQVRSTPETPIPCPLVQFSATDLFPTDTSWFLSPQQWARGEFEGLFHQSAEAINRQQ